MTAATWTNIVLGFLAAGIPVAAFLYAGRANRIQARAEEAKAEIEAKGVDAEAYIRARELYEGVIGSLREQVDRLESEVKRLSTSNHNLEKEVTGLQLSNAALRAEIETIRGR